MRCPRKILFFALFFLTTAPLSPSCAQAILPDFMSIPSPWQNVVAQANQKVKQDNSNSMLAFRLFEYVRINTEKIKGEEEIKDFFNVLYRKRTPRRMIRKCQANYGVIKEALAGNKLFSDYGIKALYPNDLCRLTGEDTGYIKRFFNGEEAPYKVIRNNNAFLIFLLREDSVLWFIANPKDMLLTFSFNDMDDFFSFSFLQNKWKEIAPLCD